MTHTPNTPKPKLHFVGIGGIGMSGIAEVFHSQGYTVSGSDASESDTTKRLSSLGIRIYAGHKSEFVENVDVVVTSSAIRVTNPEIMEAKKRRIPVIPRAEMLGELMRGRIGIALAGTHGKTTTTSLMATILNSAGLDPTIVIGGKVDALGGNAKYGKGNYVVAEADESDGSFLHLPATYVAVTNIDNDHLDHYGSMEAIEKAFIDFIARVPFYGKAVVCGDDPGVRACLDRFTKPFWTYGFSNENDFWIENHKETAEGQVFDVQSKEKGKLGTIRLRIFGKHNALNALSTVCIGLLIGLSFQAIQTGLQEFAGVRRRFEVRFDDPKKQIRVVDDYGHHPTEIEATLLAAKSSWKHGRVRVVFQPHRYSRTLNCESGFLGCFSRADELILTEIYPAGEDPIPGVTGENLFGKIKDGAKSPKLVRFAKNLEEAKTLCLSDLQPGDLILCMGAGSVTRLPDMLISGLASPV